MPAENETAVQGEAEVGVGTNGAQDVSTASADPAEATAEEEPTSPPARRMSRTGKALLGTAVLLALVLSAGAVFAHVARDRVLGDVQRIPDVFAPIDGSSRPQKSAGTENTVNFLLVGVDTRAEEQTTGRDGDGAVFVPGRQRSDVIILVHLAADRRTATVVSIPRDSWVAVPGRGRDKINAAYSGGGGSLLVQTVERLTGLRIDHFAVVDFAGFEDITDALGGVDVRVLERTGDERGSYLAGVNHLDGAAALAYVRQRHNLPGGDLDRVRRQQSVIRAMMAKAASMHLLSNPARSLDLADAVARAVSVDDSLSNDRLTSLALSVRHLQPGAVTFLTAPVRGLGHERKQSVVYLDEPRSRQLWSAIKSDDVAAYIKANGADSLGGNPR
jgi:LCP family protein required for cell wall assembly